MSLVDKLKDWFESEEGKASIENFALQFY